MTQRIAVVTGGMGGIGQAICETLLSKGLRVVAAYHREDAAALEWQQAQKKQGHDIAIVHVNITDVLSCENMTNEIEATIGPVAVLVNNAGITHDASCSKMLPEDWDIVIKTDLSSVFYVTRTVLSSMRQQNYGRIINISSINGQRGQYGQVNYSAAKAGIHGFTKALAREVAKHGITVNTISPGYVMTDMLLAVPEGVRDKILAEIPMGRFAEPKEVAAVVGFLADEESNYITGANVPINGGHYML